MILAPAHTRLELAETLSGVGVELGVAAGDFSEAILKNDRVRWLFSIDRWSDHHDEAEFRAATERLSRFELRSTIIRQTFSEALARFPDEFFDFVYIDGYAHTGQEEGRTLDDWWPKLRSGGLFSGYDYGPRYPLTVKAVDAFVRKHELILAVTDETDFPTWMTTKP